MTEKNYITILGLGNILLQDEGLGVHFVRWFENNQHVPEEELPDVFFLCIVPYKYKDMGLELTPLVRKKSRSGEASVKRTFSPWCEPSEVKKCMNYP
jgi:hypothetical protein